MPALRALGEAWSIDEVLVAAEHAASHAVLRRLSPGTDGRPDDHPVNFGTVEMHGTCWYAEKAADQI
jgi:hypothetical protein